MATRHGAKLCVTGSRSSLPGLRIQREPAIERPLPHVQLRRLAEGKDARSALGSGVSSGALRLLGIQPRPLPCWAACYPTPGSKAHPADSTATVRCGQRKNSLSIDSAPRRADTEAPCGGAGWQCNATERRGCGFPWPLCVSGRPRFVRLRIQRKPPIQRPLPQVQLRRLPRGQDAVEIESSVEPIAPPRSNGRLGGARLSAP
jgi:hypothetical protein